MFIKEKTYYDLPYLINVVQFKLNVIKFLKDWFKAILCTFGKKSYISTSLESGFDVVVYFCILEYFSTSMFNV